MKLKTSVVVACFLPGRGKDFSAPQYDVECNEVTVNLNVEGLADIKTSLHFQTVNVMQRGQ